MRRDCTHSVGAQSGRNETIAATGQLSPDGNGTFSTIYSFEFPNNESGQTVFKTQLTGTVGGPLDDFGMYFSDGISTSQIVRIGDPAPDGNGYFVDLFQPTDINSTGQIVFSAQLAGTMGGITDNEAIYRFDDEGKHLIARRGQTAAGGNGRYSDFQWLIYDINDSGQVAFDASLTGNAGGVLTDRGIFLSDGDTAVQIAREGQFAAGNGYFDSFELSVRVNNSGQVAFSGFLRETLDGTTDDKGIFLGDGSTITQIVRSGQLSGDGVIAGNVLNRGTIFADNLTVDGDLTLATSSLLDYQIGGVLPSQFDHLVISGDFTITGDLVVSLSSGFEMSFDEEFIIADVGNLLSGQFIGLGQDSLVDTFNGTSLFISYRAGDGNDVSLYTLSTVPEPGSIGLLGLCVGAIGLLARRRHGNFARRRVG